MDPTLKSGWSPSVEDSIASLQTRLGPPMISKAISKDQFELKSVYENSQIQGPCRSSLESLVDKVTRLESGDRWIIGVIGTGLETGDRRDIYAILSAVERPKGSKTKVE